MPRERSRPVVAAAGPAGARPGRGPGLRRAAPGHPALPDLAGTGERGLADAIEARAADLRAYARGAERTRLRMQEIADQQRRLAADLRAVGADPSRARAYLESRKAP